MVSQYPTHLRNALDSALGTRPATIHATQATPNRGTIFVVAGASLMEGAARQMLALSSSHFILQRRAMAKQPRYASSVVIPGIRQMAPSTVVATIPSSMEAALQTNAQMEPHSNSAQLCAQGARRTRVLWNATQAILCQASTCAVLTLYFEAGHVLQIHVVVPSLPTRRQSAKAQQTMFVHTSAMKVMRLTVLKFVAHPEHLQVARVFQKPVLAETTLRTRSSCAQEQHQMYVTTYANPPILRSGPIRAERTTYGLVDGALRGWVLLPTRVLRSQPGPTTPICSTRTIHHQGQ